MNKRFLITVFTFIFLQNASYSVNWQELQTPKNKAYIDLDSIVIKLPKLYYKVKYQNGDSYYILDFMSNYNDKTSKIFSVVKYENEKFIATNQKEEPHWYSESLEEKEAKLSPIEISQNSINEVAYNWVCGIIKANNEKTEQLKKALISVKINKDAMLDFLDADNVAINMQLKNTQNKDIKEFEGDIDVYDISNNKLAKFCISGHNLKKQSLKTMFYSWRVSDSTRERKISEIHRTNNNNLIFTFTPTKIIFDDNTSL